MKLRASSSPSRSPAHAVPAHREAGGPERTMPLRERQEVQEVLHEPGQGLKLATVATTRRGKPYRPRKKSCGDYFWKTLLAKASAWTWRQQNRELMILEMSCQVVFPREFFRKLGVPKEKTRPTWYEGGVAVGVSAKLFAKQFLDCSFCWSAPLGNRLHRPGSPTEPPQIELIVGRANPCDSERFATARR